MSKTLFFLSAAALAAALANAQAAPDWEYIPSACADSCSVTLQTAYLCENSYTDGTELYACFCNNYPSDAASCATCLNSNDAAALATLITSTETECPTAISQCSFECAFPTCSSSDIDCQCSEEYLADIYNCASCNTANGNTDATTINNFNDLQQSCANQNFTGASQDFTTQPLPTIVTDGYTAPTLTATGGGAAASDTGAVAIATASSATDASDSSASGTTESTAAAATTTTAAAVAATTKASSAAAATTTKASSAAVAATTKAASAASSGASASASASAAASSTAKSGAGALAVPALAGVVALAGGVLALF